MQPIDAESALSDTERAQLAESAAGLIDPLCGTAISPWVESSANVETHCSGEPDHSVTITIGTASAKPYVTRELPTPLARCSKCSRAFCAVCYCSAYTELVAGVLCCQQHGKQCLRVREGEWDCCIELGCPQPQPPEPPTNPDVEFVGALGPDLATRPQVWVRARSCGCSFRSSNAPNSNLTVDGLLNVDAFSLVFNDMEMTTAHYLIQSYRNN